MSEEINISFTKDEWRAISVLVRNQIKGVNIDDFEEKRQKLKNLLASYEREKTMLNREEVYAKTYHSILGKIDTKA